MRRHLCIPFSGLAADKVEAWRRRWDPAMAQVVPAHVSLVYPEETADEELLLRRARQACELINPFELRLGAVRAGEGGWVYLVVTDVDGGWTRLRQALLGAPMTPVEVTPHVTVVHPRTSSQGAECLASLGGLSVNVSIDVSEVLLTETTTEAFKVLRRFPLRAAGSPASVHVRR